MGWVYVEKFARPEHCKKFRRHRLHVRIVTLNLSRQAGLAMPSRR